MATSNYTAATHKLTRRISTTSGDANSPPVAERLQSDAASLRAVAPQAPVVDHRQCQQPAHLSRASALTRIDPGLLNGIDPLTEYPPCIVW